MGYFTKAKREDLIILVGLILFYLIDAGALDNYLLVVFPVLVVLLYVYLRSNYRRHKESEPEYSPTATSKVRD